MAIHQDLGLHPLFFQALLVDPELLCLFTRICCWVGNCPNFSLEVNGKSSITMEGLMGNSPSHVVNPKTHHLIHQSFGGHFTVSQSGVSNVRNFYWG